MSIKHVAANPLVALSRLGSLCKGRTCLALALAGLTVACDNMPPIAQGTVEQLFAGGAQPSLQQQGDLHYAVLKGQGTTPIVLIHGSPGDWQSWSVIMKDAQLTRMGDKIAMDRPGFGKSIGASAAGQVMPDLRAQAQLLAKLIPDGQQAIVVGHSLGGPLAVWMALDNPDKVCAAISVAGSISSQYEAPRWYNHVANLWLAKYVVPAEMLASNQEMMLLQKELMSLEAQLPKLQKPVIVIQGMKDDLVIPDSVTEFEGKVPPHLLQVHRVADQNHFLHWNQPKLLIDAIVLAQQSHCGSQAHASKGS